MVYDPSYEDAIYDRQVVADGTELAALGRMGDGRNYSRSLGWQSPEGNFYGQTRVIRDWEIRIIWDGFNYHSAALRGVATSKATLPIKPTPFYEFWGIPNGRKFEDTPADQIYAGGFDIYYFDSDEQEWKAVEWLWDIHDSRSVPYPGIRKGVGHRVFLRDVQVVWDGYVWRKFRHSTLDDDEADRHLPPGFISDNSAKQQELHDNISQLAIDMQTGDTAALENANQQFDTLTNTLYGEVTVLQNTITGNHNELSGAISSSHNELLDSINSVNSSLSQSITGINNDINTFSSDNYITFVESKSLKIAFVQLEAESEKIVAIATALGIVAEKTAYVNAVEALENELNNWVGLNESLYPITVTAAQRTAINNALALVKSTRDELSKRINDENIDYFDGEITSTRSALEQQITDSRAGVEVILSDEIDGVRRDIVIAIDDTERVLWDGINVAKADLEQAISEVQGYIDDLNNDVKKRIADARVIYLGNTELGIGSSVDGTVGALWINIELVVATSNHGVTTSNPIVNLTNGSLFVGSIAADTEYYIYWANNVDAAFNLPSHDCRGKLFLSLTPPVDGYLGDTGVGLNARVVGQIKTDNTSGSKGGPFFIRELEISWISRKVSLPETYREYCDFQTTFVDAETLEFKRTDGLFGQIFIAGQLILLGEGITVKNDDVRVGWLTEANPLTYDWDDILPNTLYYIYVCNDMDCWNFNDINPNTGRPWRESDLYATLFYVAELDLRQNMFLSTKAHEHGSLSGGYPGYYARHVGQIWTDANGLFKYASDISAIRQLTLNPTHLEGLADLSFKHIDDDEFQIVRRTGTNGIVYVASRPVQMYEANSENVHKIKTSDVIYNFNSNTTGLPITASSQIISNLVGVPIYIYLANDRDVWGSFKGKIFATLTPWSGGYLSRNYPGYNARWLCTIKPVPLTFSDELIMNGMFENDATWVWGSGWSFSAENQSAKHTAGTEPLTQTIAVDSGATYRINFQIFGCDAGSIKVGWGAESDESLYDNGSYLILAVATSNTLTFKPSTTFNGLIDFVSVKKATSGNLGGSYLIDGVGLSGQDESIVLIDDGVVSSNQTWSSRRIQQEFAQYRALIDMASAFNQQKTAGLPIRLEYYSTSQVALYPTSGEATIIFPNFTTRVIPSAGLKLTITGNPGAFYYVWLSDNNLIMNTEPPDATYSRLKTRGTTHILVGYIGCTGTNTITGEWNVFSLYNETAKSWGTNVLNTPSTTNTWYGAIVAPGKTFSTSRSGTSSWAGNVDWYMDSGGLGHSNVVGLTTNGFATGSYSVRVLDDGEYNFYVDPTPPGGSAWWSGSVYRAPWPYAAIAIAMTTTGVITSIGDVTVTLTHTQALYMSGPCNNNRWGYTSWVNISGQLVLSRPASDW